MMELFLFQHMCTAEDGGVYALSLRVYGTMIKGFCVINNDRAKILHSDCERMVLLFAEQPYSEPVMKLPAAKRQRVDALTLDLTRVHAAEAFDWTATPLEMLTLEVERLPEPPDSSDWAVAVPALDEAAGSLLVTNFFPEQPMPAEPQTEMHEPPPAQVEICCRDRLQLGFAAGEYLLRHHDGALPLSARRLTCSEISESNVNAFQKTHPQKASVLGHRDADATVVSPMLLGCADGVSQIEEFGIDASKLPRELLDACEDQAMNLLVPDEAGKISGAYEGPVPLMREAFKKTRSLGSTTVCRGSQWE
eukprot:g14900.t1